jgi:acyl-CoA synthetase (AMP-forming)/AMP-acid ligase II
MTGAEPVSPRVLRRFSDAFAPCGFRPEAFFPVYGLAEATVAVTFPKPMSPTRVDCIDRAVLESEGRAVPRGEGEGALELVGHGRPIAHTEVRILGEDGAELPERGVGEIEVRSATLMEGYYGDPEGTAAAIVDGWLRTGDLGYVAEGDLFVTGRKKEIIIKGGRNLVPSVLEEIVTAVPGVRAGCVAAIGVVSPERETELAIVVAETKLPVDDHARLADAVRDALKANGIAIDQVRLVAPGTLPKTTSGKIRRGELAALLDLPSGRARGTKTS